MEQDKTIVYMEFTNSGEASIVKGALESNSIPCFLSNENSPYAGGVLTGGLFGVRLHIFEKDKDQADEVMSLINLGSDDEESIWSDIDLEDVSD